MPDPIVPPTPTVYQPSTGPVTPPTQADNSPGIEQVQAIFDRVMPPAKGESVTPPPVKEVPPPKPPDTPPLAEPVEPPKEPKPEVKPPTEHKLPSFLEEALKGEEAPKPPSAPPEDEWPEELPQFKTPEESKTRYKNWRKSYNTLKEELKKAREIPPQNAEQQNRLAFLEGQNREMAAVLTRFGVEQSAEFQNNIMRPLYASWNEAARIVKESGANPEDLAKAMSLSGKPRFEALDTLFSEMPESAKAEVHDALRHYTRFDEARKQALANAPATFEGIRKRELERQYQEVGKQREQMKGFFDTALRRLRDDAQLEIFQKSTDPEATWWNEQGDRLIAAAQDLYMENTDMNRVAVACLLAPAADVYRKLWMAAQKKAIDLQKVIDDRFGNEPTLSESPGNAANLVPEKQMQEDLKRPFSEVFLREFHKAQARSR